MLGPGPGRTGGLYGEGGCIKKDDCQCAAVGMTRMHSSRMRTVYCSSHLLGGGGCLPGGSAQRGVCQRSYATHTPRKQN